jgi:hypothetical protein
MVELWVGVGGPSPAWAALAGYAAAVTTHAPLVALLGARRPHQAAWQWIVASLVLILTWPALSDWLDNPSGAGDLHAVWRGFHLLLIALGLFNGLATRRWAATVLYALGQVVLLSDALPELAAGWIALVLPDENQRGLVGLALIVGGVGAGSWAPYRRVPPSFDRLWGCIRDDFGVIWALRILERFNATAVAQGWDVRITWAGLRSAGDAVAALPAPARQALHNLLRRFASEAWIAEREGGA